jgi:hypothetical protein
MSDNWNKESYTVSKHLSQRAFSGFYSNFVSLMQYSPSVLGENELKLCSALLEK